MAELAGLTIGIFGIAGLFSACVENFDIVVRAKTFSDEFDFLCTQLSLQQIRLVLWGESLGLVQGPNRPRVPYNNAIDRADIRPAIELALNHLRLLLEKADVVIDRYEFNDEASRSPDAAQARGMDIFRGSFEKFKTRLRKNQKQKSTWSVTRWSVHDISKFDNLVKKTKDLIDSLEAITASLGVLEQQLALLKEEVASVSDTRSLRILQKVATKQSSIKTRKAISDAASVRLSILAASVSDNSSYHTAPSYPSKMQYGMAVIADVPEPTETDGTATPRYNSRDGPEEHLNPIEEQETVDIGGPAGKKTLKTLGGTEVPQNQRVARELMKKYPPNPPQLAFCSGSSQYGKHLAPIKAVDDNLWREISAPLAVKASFDGSSDLSVARRTFLQLRSIRRAGIPFISAAPVGDSLNKILASIEGPPDTPYASGIFWITITIPEHDCRPPLVRFQTRIYHPNIDCHGNVCADYAEWWNDPSLRVYMKTITQEYNAAWFSERRSNHFSLGTVLTALCSLLASPSIDDPLVPEIAEKYISDYSGYCEAARLYTEKYATGQRPSDEELVFKTDTIDNAYQPSQFVPTQKGSSNTSSYLDTPATTLSRTSTSTGNSTLTTQSTLSPSPDSERMSEELKIHMGLVLDPFFKSPSEITPPEPSSTLNEPPPPGFLKSMFLLPENKNISERSDALPSDYGWEEASSFLFYSHGRNDVPLGRLVSSTSDVGPAQRTWLPTIFQDIQGSRREDF